MRAGLLMVALSVALLGALPHVSALAEESHKALPTLLIKGELVSVDTSDPSSMTLKVKDRYGFETPIFFSNDTSISQDGATKDIDILKVGASVEVEYNFDINTTKRYAVSIRVPKAESAESAVKETVAPLNVEETTSAGSNVQKALPSAAASQSALPAQGDSIKATGEVKQ